MEGKCSCSSKEHSTGWQKLTGEFQILGQLSRTVFYHTCTITAAWSTCLSSTQVLQCPSPVQYNSNTLLLPMVLFSTHRTSFPGELQFSGTPSTVFKSHEPSTKTCTSVTERRVAPRQELQRHNEQPKGGRRRYQEEVLPPVSFSCTSRFDLIIPNALSLLRNQILHQNRFKKPLSPERLTAQARRRSP